MRRPRALRQDGGGGGSGGHVGWRARQHGARSVPPGNAAPGAGAQEPFASGVGGPFGGELSAARPQLIRALNGRLLLGHIRDLGPCSRAELARLSGLSKPTVSVALADAERAGLVRTAGQRTGRPGRSALLYEVRPEAGFILGLDVGAQYVRGALADLAGGIRARASVRSRASSVRGRVGELIGLADGLCARGRAHPGQASPRRSSAAPGSTTRAATPWR